MQSKSIKKHPFKNQFLPGRVLQLQNGQALVEYLLLLALMIVASIGVIKVLQNTVNSQYANVVTALQGKTRGKIQAEEIKESHYKKKDLSDFLNGAINRDR